MTRRRSETGRGLKPGETSQPVQDNEGWHIVQSIERKPMDPPSYEAIQRMLQAIDQFVIQGPKTTLGLARAIIDHPDFRNNRVSTRWLEAQLHNLQSTTC